jgi:hypothetical protein
MSTHADDLQHRLLREPARFVEDVRIAHDGRVQARFWSPLKGWATPKALHESASEG